VLNGTTSVQPYDPSIDSAANKAFVEAYKKKSGGAAPIMVGFESYEATRILLDAIKRAGSTDPAAIRDALAKTRYQSLMGTTLEFDKNNLVHNNAVIVGIRDGKVVVFGYSKT
jgi:branched-chain amino acid transport system substrate-binding protein